VKFIAIAKL